MSQHIPTKKSPSDLRNVHDYEAKDLLRRAWIMPQHITKQSRSDLRNLHELRGNRLVAQVSQTRFANRSGFDTPIGVLAWEERGSCLNIFRTTNRGRISETFTSYEQDLLRKRQIAVGSQKRSRIMRQKTCCEVCQTRRFANRVGFDAPIGVVLAWEERRSCSTYSGRTNRGRISETCSSYEAKDCCASESNTSVRLGMGGSVIMYQHIPDDKSWSDLRNLHKLRAKRLVALVSQTRRFRVVFANRSGFDTPIGVILAWEERGSSLNIFRMKKSRSDLRNLQELRGKRLVAQVSQTRRRFALYSQTGVVLMLQLESSWHGRSVDHVSTYSDDKSRWISETFTNYEAEDLLRKSVKHVGSRMVLMLQLESSWHGRSVEPVSTYYRTKKSRSDSQKPSRLTRQKTCCASESNTSVRVVSRTKVVLMLQLESSWHWRSVDHVSTYSGRQSWSDLRNIHELRGKDLLRKQKTCCASESNTSVCEWFDAPIGVVLAWEGAWIMSSTYSGRQSSRISETFTNYEAKGLLRKSGQTSRFALYSQTGVVLMLQLESSWAWEERGSCLNIFRTTNPSRISETHHELRGKRLVAQVSQTHWFANGLMLQLESSWHGRSVDHVSTYSGRQIAVGSQKPSPITRQKTCCASESNTSERESCLNIFRTTNRGRISETFTNYEAKKLVAQVSQTCQFANRSGFDAPIGVVFAWWERGSSLNIFRRRNRDRISETFTNYEAKDLLHNESNTSIRIVFANRSGFNAPIGVFFAWEERGSCLNIFRTTNRGLISETLTNYEEKDSLRK
ncbi:uncharacterized protein G2W53_033627 [Senna tora]|uniref:Uncharacterized protein n=1 Tax=Senna tora TaxID=362788 RepID=A0A834SZR3_9FABA|nr:uncharacterized protein G2W53_033627 [Senna tora]